MAYFELWVHKVSDDEIVMSHVFYGQTEAEAEERYAQHRNQCPDFQAAYAMGDTIEDMVESDDPPPSPDDFPDDEEDDEEEEGDEESEEAEA
jgi:hypothetical protein